MGDEKEIEVVIAGLVLDPGSNAPIVILKDASGEQALPIWIGLAEATAIASALKQVPFVRPMTH
ncbi:MAG: bifunctional nuclease family protein, partial [Deltaproteobacteria bacterium]|nr:bifunctional nuclease family protein [Deltaproteobacteria bacterium]